MNRPMSDTLFEVLVVVVGAVIVALAEWVVSARNPRLLPERLAVQSQNGPHPAS
jgi:hypothetical protein